MIQILEDQPSFGQLMARGGGQAIGSALAGGAEGYIDKKKKEQLAKQLEEENRSLERITGKDLSGITNPQLRQEIVKSLMGKSGQAGLSSKNQERLAAAQQGLKTVGRQKERLATGHLGPKVSFLPGQSSKLLSAISPEGRTTRSGYEQAGKELIQLASTLPIRNQVEFETLAHNLYDPTMNEAEIEGVLNEMEEHIKDAIQSISPEGMEMQDKINRPSREPKRERFDINNPAHRARRNEVLKKTKNNREKAEMVLLKEFEL